MDQDHTENPSEPENSTGSAVPFGPEAQSAEIGAEQETLPAESGETPQSGSNIPLDTSQSPPPTYTDEELQPHLEHIAPLPEEEKLWQLKLMARDHSLEKAIAVVKKMNDPWLEDRFHDDLMDDPEWRAQLEALGKIEKL